MYMLLIVYMFMRKKCVGVKVNFRMFYRTSKYIPCDVANGHFAISFPYLILPQLTWIK